MWLPLYNHVPNGVNSWLNEQCSHVRLYDQCSANLCQNLQVSGVHVSWRCQTGGFLMETDQFVMIYQNEFFTEHGIGTILQQRFTDRIKSSADALVEFCLRLIWSWYGRRDLFSEHVCTPDQHEHSLCLLPVSCGAHQQNNSSANLKNKAQ